MCRRKSVRARGRSFRRHRLAGGLSCEARIGLLRKDTKDQILAAGIAIAIIMMAPVPATSVSARQPPEPFTLAESTDHSTGHPIRFGLRQSIQNQAATKAGVTNTLDKDENV